MKDWTEDYLKNFCDEAARVVGGNSKASEIPSRTAILDRIAKKNYIDAQIGAIKYSTTFRTDGTCIFPYVITYSDGTTFSSYINFFTILVPNIQSKLWDWTVGTKEEYDNFGIM